MEIGPRIRAFMTSGLDECNSLYVGLDHPLDLVQRAAAHLLTGEKKREHVTPEHYLPPLAPCSPDVTGQAPTFSLDL